MEQAVVVRITEPRIVLMVKYYLDNFDGPSIDVVVLYLAIASCVCVFL